MTDPHVVVCPTCGTSGPAAKRFCTACGTPRPAPVAEVAPVADPEATATRPRTGPVCGRCGAALVPGKRFCGRCGQAVAVPLPDDTAVRPPVPVAPVAPATAPVAAPGERRRRGRAVLVGALVVLLLGAGTAAGVVLLTGDDDPGTTVADDDRPAPDATDPSTDEPVGTEPTVTAEPTPAPTVATPDPEPSPTPVRRARCWEGTVTAEVADCPYPEGTDGLRHVFAGFDFAGEGCDTTGVREGGKRRYVYACEREGEAWFNFSEFDTAAAGRRYFEDNAGAIGTPERGDLLRWTFYNGSEYKGALAYADGRWGVTVYSLDAETRDRTLANLARRMLPAATVQGRQVR